MVQVAWSTEPNSPPMAWMSAPCSTKVENIPDSVVPPFLPRRGVQHGAMSTASAVDVRTVVKKECQIFFTRFLTHQSERRAQFAMLIVDVGALVEEQLQHWPMAFNSCCMECCDLDRRTHILRPTTPSHDERCEGVNVRALSKNNISNDALPCICCVVKSSIQVLSCRIPLIRVSM